MQYREDKLGNKLSVLGLGCMRFPRSKADTEHLILAAIEGGINYIDTAYMYPNSESTLGEILAKHNKRKDVYIATKLPFSFCKTSADFDRYFDEQLKRLQTNYVDYYFIHAISDYEQWIKLKNLGIEQWINKKKATGQIRQIGFSFHGTYKDFLKVLNAYSWEFCMIQYNYFDENYQAGKKGLLAAAEKNIPVMVMEPLLGGTLATNLPQKAKDLFTNTNSNLTPADWAFWWLWNQSEITVVLSGMSNTQILESNLCSVKEFRPLTDDELAIYAEVVNEFKKTYKINCTGCNYCLPCPKGINIPDCFFAHNASFTQGFYTGMTQYVVSIGALSKNRKSPRSCNQCGKCEKACPQNIPIRKELKKIAGRFESLPMRIVLEIMRYMRTR